MDGGILSGEDHFSFPIYYNLRGFGCIIQKLVQPNVLGTGFILGNYNDCIINVKIHVMVLMKKNDLQILNYGVKSTQIATYMKVYDLRPAGQCGICPVLHDR